MNNQITGTVKLVANEGGVSKNGNTWQKQIVVIETINGQYTKNVAFEVFGENKVKELAIQQGEQITVTFDASSRDSNGRWFTTLSIWKVDRGGAATPAPATEDAPEPFPVPGLPVQGANLPGVPRSTAADGASASNGHNDYNDKLPF